MAGGSLKPQQLFRGWGSPELTHEYRGRFGRSEAASFVPYNPRVMRGISQLRRGRSLLTRAKRAKIRRRKPRFADVRLLSKFRAAPRKPRPTQPYLSTDVNIAELLR